MVTGYKNDIKVWTFENGQMSKKIFLNGHTRDVQCLVFSKKLNWFASGSEDKTIRCWKEEDNGEWISTQPATNHTKSIFCLLLNRNEDELISCSGEIIIWDVNCKNNQLNYKYTLDMKHTKRVLSITMNDQESYLASCGQDKKIILWIKDQDKKWNYVNEIINDDVGCRLSFISDYQILWQQGTKGITHFFEIKDGLLIKRPELNIQLDEEDRDHSLFPTIFNKNKQVIVQSHNKYVYLLKKQENDKLQLVYDPIDCNDKENFGALTEDGEFLVVWDWSTSEGRVHRIQYK